MLLLAAACGDPTSGDGPDRVLSAAGTAAPEAPVTVPPPTTTTTLAATTRAVVTPTTVGTAPTAPRTATTRPPATPAKPSAGYSPPPPPPGVVPDGYLDWGGVIEASSGGNTVKLSVYPRQQYFGEMMQVNVQAIGKDAVTSLTIDFGNGHVVTGTRMESWACTSDFENLGGSWYVYPAPGQYRITATVDFVACGAFPGPPPGAVPQTVAVAMDIVQRPDRPPAPTGPPSRG